MLVYINPGRAGLDTSTAMSSHGNLSVFPGGEHITIVTGQNFDRSFWIKIYQKNLDILIFEDDGLDGQQLALCCLLATRNIDVPPESWESFDDYYTNVSGLRSSLAAEHRWRLERFSEEWKFLGLAGRRDIVSWMIERVP
jgi:hypothetical protein